MRSRLPIVIVIAAMLLLAGSTVAHPSADNVQVIAVKAKKYEFSPLPIRVKQGTHVQLRVTATDHVHGFKIDEFPEGSDRKGNPGLVYSASKDCLRIEKGQTETLEFTAQTAGTYEIRCCVHCGWSHRSMKGRLIVEP
jgi:heme/copper-type cytochrome/quinol oxidase subunit 2